MAGCSISWCEVTESFLVNSSLWLDNFHIGYLLQTFNIHIGPSSKVLLQTLYPLDLEIVFCHTSAAVWLDNCHIRPGGNGIKTWWSIILILGKGKYSNSMFRDVGALRKWCEWSLHVLCMFMWLLGALGGVSEISLRFHKPCEWRPLILDMI